MPKISLLSGIVYKEGAIARYRAWQCDITPQQLVGNLPFVLSVFELRH